MMLYRRRPERSRKMIACVSLSTWFSTAVENLTLWKRQTEKQKHIVIWTAENRKTQEIPTALWKILCPFHR